MVKPPEFSVLRLRPIINQDGLQMSGLNLKALIDPNILNALNHFVVEVIYFIFYLFVTFKNLIFFH